ncbi:MAG TPA: YHS domain-containing protein [candidate division Zixibacteria bacterium]|nr:YHS domain-containing protein [candidate division Zixibacteria bacterium]
MKKLQFFSIVFALSIFTFGLALAGEGHEKAEKTAKSESAEKADAVEMKAQTICPVMGGKIDKEVYTDIQGQRVYHCCPGCSGALVADPDKYFKKAAAEGVLFENIQTTCPVSGKELEKKEVYADYEGRRVYFCCAGCVASFEEDPQKYLMKLDEKSSTDEQAEEPEMKMETDGHQHEM